MVDSQFRTFVECIEEQGLITDDILFEGIAEELQTISPIFAEPRWVTIDGNEGLETFVQDADGCGGNIILATAKLSSAAKLLARSFLERFPEALYSTCIIGNPALVVDGLTWEDDGRRLHLYAGVYTGQ